MVSHKFLKSLLETFICAQLCVSCIVGHGGSAGPIKVSPLIGKVKPVGMQAFECSPVPNEASIEANDDKCKLDDDCSEGQKCCQTIVGKVCMSVKETQMAVENYEIRHTKWGHCPSVAKKAFKSHFVYRLASCRADKDCPGHKKCCPTAMGPSCMLPARAKPHLNVCEDGSQPFGACYGFWCPYGYECQSGACCRILKRGACPQTIHSKIHRFIHLASLNEPCDCDCDCIGNYKCCLEDGQAICAKPTYNGVHLLF
uniref:WAP domain-containing protein n=1 Tax=Trichuris muris TaxID=70415 RepID=A0A5S6R3T5_TRIMR